VLKEKEKVLVVGCFKDEDISSKAAFESVANAHHRDFVFGLCTDPSLLHPYGIALYKDFDDRKVVLYNGGMDDEEAIWAFVKSESTPLIVDFRLEVHSRYLEVCYIQPTQISILNKTQAGLPLGYIFLPSSQASEQRSNLESMIRPLALKYKNKIQFGTIDVQISQDIVEEMHLDTSPTAKWPTFAIREPILDHRYLFDKNGQTSPSEQELSSFLSSFFEGTLKRDIHSEPIPTSQTTAVQNIVGLTFDSLVLETDKDVFVEFYTQTCAPCKAMAPQWEKLAQSFDNNVEGKKRVMIGQIDAEANDVPGDIRGFPWLLLYPAGKKDEPVLYSGKTTVEDMALFVKQQGTFGVDVLKTGS
jgi:protein disulfide-isomerase A1